MMKQFKLLSTLIPVVLLLTGCFSQRSMRNMVVEQPQVDSLRLSFVRVPVKMNATKLLKQASGIITKELTNDEWPKYTQNGCEYRYKYRFIKDTVLFEMQNNYLEAHIKGKYQLAGSACECLRNKPVTPIITESCGFGEEPMRSIDLNLGSLLTITNDWKLKTSSEVSSVVANDKCMISDNSIDVTSMVVDTIKGTLQNYTSSADGIIENIDFTEAVDSNWRRINNAIELPLSMGYIKASFASISLGKINLRNDTLYAAAGISFKPTLYSNKPVAAETPPLINLETLQDNSPVYDIQADAIYSFDSLKKVLAPFVINKEFKLQLKQKIKITKIDIRQDNELGRIAIQAWFTGTKRGSFTLHGTPVLDVAKQTISIPDMYYQVQSKNIFVKLGNSMFKKRIYKALKKATTVSLNGYKLMAMASLNTMLNKSNGDVITSGSVKSIEANALQTVRKQFLVRITVNGKAGIEIKSK
jgi:hypothetical protein